jgi:hypothetical protein
MTFRFKTWLANKWHGVDSDLVNSYLSTFNAPHGQRVLQHLLDSVYCTIYEGSDPIALAVHNGRRSVIHEILENIEIAENPARHAVSVQQEAVDD